MEGDAVAGRRAEDARYVARFASGDLEGLRKFFADGVLGHVGGSHFLSGDYHGRDALIQYFERVRDLTGGTMQLEPESILAGERYTAMFTRVRGERDGRSLDVLMAQVFKLGSDGRWAEYWAAAEDQDDVDAFWHRRSPGTASEHRSAQPTRRRVGAG